MGRLPINKLTLDRLCEYAELYWTVKDIEEKFYIDQRAYHFLVYSGFKGDQMVRFIANYNRMKQEFVH